MQPQIEMFSKNDQIKNLERVRDKVMTHVIAFCRHRYDNFPSGIFNMRDLVIYCLNKGVKCGFESPSRMLRLAKEEGKLSYDVLSRHKSRYQILWVK